MFSSNKHAREQIGQALPEYSVLISLIALVVVAVFALMGPALVDIFQVLVDTF
jgi:Flp pilus assembly pilin Flp